MSGSSAWRTSSPPSRLLVAIAAGPDDTTVIEAVLTPVADGIRLVVEERGIPERKSPAYGAGWQVHLEDLAVHLAGDEPEDWRPRRQARLPEFRERGPADGRTGLGPR